MPSTADFTSSLYALMLQKKAQDEMRRQAQVQNKMQQERDAFEREKWGEANTMAQMQEARQAQDAEFNRLAKVAELQGKYGGMAGEAEPSAEQYQDPALREYATLGYKGGESAAAAARAEQKQKEAELNQKYFGNMMSEGGTYPTSMTPGQPLTMQDLRAGNVQFAHDPRQPRRDKTGKPVFYSTDHIKDYMNFISKGQGELGFKNTAQKQAYTRIAQKATQFMNDVTAGRIADDQAVELFMKDPEVSIDIQTLEAMEPFQRPTTVQGQPGQPGQGNVGTAKGLLK